MSDSFDFIICGGGTSGCVVASRLAEDPHNKILVIEAGPHNEHLDNVHMVGGWSQNFDNETDWNIVSEKKSSVNDRQVKLSRGKFLGGCSGYFDDWNLEGWSGDEFFDYMKKAENFHSKPWFKADTTSHGYNGYLDTEPHDLAPISNLIKDSMVSEGLPLDDDMFSHGNNSHGCGHAVRTVYQGLRTTGADFITKTPPKDNLTLMVSTYVDKVMIQNGKNGEPIAVGVTVVNSDGRVMDIKARKEVIISGGAYCSPNILNRSGIGATEELKKHGITTIVDLPGVGKNLQDHLIAFIFYQTEKPGLTTDHLIHHDEGFSKSYELWKQHRTGFLSSFPFGIFAFARLDERLSDSKLWNSAPRRKGRDPMGLSPAQPNVEFFTTECYGGPKQFDDPPTNGEHAFAMIAELFAPKSRGTVSLRNKDPTATPVVDCNYLSDPLDVEVMAEACRFGNEIIMRGAGTKNIVKGSWPPSANHHKLQTREDWVPYVRENATTCYHAAGTCAMGKQSDPFAVLDEKLRVKGVKGLRVADCSVMPLLNSGHTQMPAFGIGEKAADLIKEEWLQHTARL
ncbi:hypothetical protein LCI18_013756 [Fusarium solani-melongenae]|uniref:Uncharacterized protein n=1 Tax=Fusarium solani subsp. cucurbitae TaxID=2747967 RepID=A0ACD3ZNN2_FUSSC|nr:hypothetical protein LCI18_013756 [Fusarium solani-melongenae]